MNDIHKRTRFLIQTLGPNPNALAVKLNMRSITIYYIMGNQKRTSKPNLEFICKMIATFPQINPRWYLLGEGIWNGNDKLMGKKSNKFKEALSEMKEELDKYKKLYAEELFINDALREKIRRSI